MKRLLLLAAMLLGSIQGFAQSSIIFDIPSKVVIYGHMWDIQVVYSLADAKKSYSDLAGSEKEVVADTNCKDRIIRLTMMNGPLLKETIIHEFLHAGACENHTDETFYNSKVGPQHNALDHQGLDNAAMVLFEILRMNPEMTKFLFN